MKRLTYERALALLTEIVNERPDYIYEPPAPYSRCVYRDPAGQPSCLIGHMLVRDGVDLDAVDAAMMPSHGGLETIGVGAVARFAYDQVEYEALRLLVEVQANQDRRFPWGGSLSKAVALVGEQQCATP